MLGAKYSPQVYAHIAQHYADGVPETELPAIASLFATDQPVVDNRQTLRVVGGEL